nr:hypothetical protein [uncultured Dongia sp.]
MSRIRSIHAAFFKDDGVVSTSAWARLLLIGLWTQSDDHGVFEWKPGEMKRELFPDQPVEIVPLLAELIEHDRIRSFEVDGRRYGVSRNFGEYQKPKKPGYRYPLPGVLAAYAGFEGEQPPGKGKGSPAAANVKPPANDVHPAPVRPDGAAGDKVRASAERDGEILHGTKSATYQSSSSPPVGNQYRTGGEPVPLGEERRGREERESPATSSLNAARPPGAVDRVVHDRECRVLIDAFDAALVAEWGAMAGRAHPHGQDYPIARAWVLGGADAALVAEVARREFPRMHQRNVVPKLLKIIDPEMRAALADRAQIKSDGRPDIERDRWAPQMVAWERGTWLPNWGDPPGSPHCPMPKRLQDECLSKRVA